MLCQKNCWPLLYQNLANKYLLFYFENFKNHIKIKCSRKTEKVKLKYQLLPFHVKTGQVAGCFTQKILSKVIKFHENINKVY